MYLQLYNLSGAKQKIQGVPGEIAAHANVQRFNDISCEAFSHEDGIKVSEHLANAKAAGKIDYQFVLEAKDYGCGLIGTKVLTVDVANGGVRGGSLEADTSQIFSDDDALPAGALFLNAHLDVHTVLSGGAVSAAVVKSGHDSDDDAFDASENVFANATRRQLTTLTLGTDIGGKKLYLTLTTTDGNVDDLTAGKISLVVNYLLNPTL